MTQAPPAAVSQECQERLFTQARTHNSWQDKPVSDDTLRALYDLMKWGPTSANCSPTRILFLKSEAQKKILEPMLMAGNRAKTMSAPVVAIVAWERKFYDRMDFLFPHAPGARNLFAKEENDAFQSAMRNASMQGGYFILAARALGLDCGPMSGFNAAAVNAHFFPQDECIANFLCNLGYGDASQLHPRLPRFAFDDACKIL